MTGHPAGAPPEDPGGGSRVEMRGESRDSSTFNQIGTQIIYNYGSKAEAGGGDGGRRPGGSTWAVAVYGDEHSGALGAGVVIGARRVLTCARVCAGPIDEDGHPIGPLQVRFSKVNPPVPGTQSRRVIGVRLPEGRHDLAVLLLEDAVPTGVRAAQLRRPVPDDLAGLDWWAFGFPEGQRLGDEAFGTVGTALGEGFVRLDARSSCRAETGFSGSGLWSPDYGAVVGIIGAALTRDGDTWDDHIGGALAITLFQADRCFGAEGLAEVGGWSAEQAGEVAMSSWGWALRDDPESGPHWRPRSRGFDDRTEGGYWFRGRRAALTEITGWLDRDRNDRRALVVTGSPGVGKSAVLGRVVTTADPGVSSELPDDDVVRAVEGSVACAVHAKSKTALNVAEEIARATSARLPGRPVDLAPAVRAALAAQGTGRFNVVIDALDEAASSAEARLIISQVVQPLLQQCADTGAQVVIGTRRQDDVGSLIKAFRDDKVLIDLDADEYFALEDLEAYALATLQQLGSERLDNPYADEDVARPLASRIAELSNKNFLVAYLTALTHGSVDQEPADLEELTYTMDIKDALHGFLDRFGEVDGIPLSATRLLTALAYAEAPGLPIELWITAVEALYGVRPAEDKLDDFTQSAAANFLAESGQDPNQVFRLYHQALNDTLLDDRARRTVKDQRTLTRAFIDYGRQVGWASAPPYLRRSLSHHAERAGMLDELLTDDEYLLHADLHRLTPQAQAATDADNATDAGKQRARLLQLTPYAASAKPQERRAMFSVTEALEKLGDSFTSSPGSAPYRAHWSTVATRAERLAQEGHAGGVQVVCSLVLDGRTLLASGGDDEIVRIWDPATGRQQRALEGHAGLVLAAQAFTVGGGRTLLASAGADAAVRVWDPATGKQERMLEGHVGPVTTVCSITVGGGRTLLASAGADAAVRVWDPATGKQERVLEGHASAATPMCSLTAGDGQALAFLGDDGKILVWDPVGGDLRTTLERRPAAGDDDTGEVTAMCAFTGADGRIALAAASAGMVGVWDLSSGCYRVLHGRTDLGTAWEICPFTSGGRKLLASAGPDDKVRVWDPVSGQQRRVLKAPDEVWSVCAFTARDGHALLASAGLDPAIQIWDPVTGQQRQALQGHAEAPWSVCAFTAADGRTLLASGGSTVRIYDQSTGHLQRSLECPAGGARSVCAFTAADGRTMLASAGADGLVRIWDPATGQLRRSLEGGTGRVWAVRAFAAQDGRTLLASAGADALVRIWDPAAGRLLRAMEGHAGDIWDLTTLVTADGKTLLVSAGGDGMARVWDPATGQQQRAFAGAADGVNAVCAFTTQDGRASVALTGLDGIIQVWDLATRALRRTLADNDLMIRSLSSFTLAGRTLVASCGDDGKIRVWDPASGQLLRAIPVHLTPNTVTATENILVVGLSAGLLTIELNLEGLTTS